MDENTEIVKKIEPENHYTSLREIAGDLEILYGTAQ